jgi:hypothetical protein
MTAESMGGRLQGLYRDFEVSRSKRCFPGGKKQAIRNAQMSRLANAPEDTTATLGLNSGFEVSGDPLSKIGAFRY